MLYRIIWQLYSNKYLFLKKTKKDPKIAPAIQQHREELEKRKIADNLRHKIDHRPTAEELAEKNILKGKV
jgi:hypothetical protein